MDLMYFLAKRLDFVEYLHAEATGSFRETKRKIDSEEPPYVDARDPQYADGPAFYAEWERADAAETAVGVACIELLIGSLHAFLDAYLLTSAVSKNDIKRKGSGGWFASYRCFFSERLGIDWAASGSDLAFLEQLILARNDFTHNVKLTSFLSFQVEPHREKYPDSAFVDSLWPRSVSLQRAAQPAPQQSRRCKPAGRNTRGAPEQPPCGSIAAGMELAIRISIERLPEGVYLATSQELPGLVAQGHTVEETLDIARDVARKLVDARGERDGAG